MTRARRDPIALGIAAVAVLLAGIAGLGEGPVGLTTAAALPLALVLPGWAIQRAFLRDRPRDPLYVASFALGMSLAVATLGSTALAIAQELSGAAFAAALAAVTVVACSVAVGRGVGFTTSSSHGSTRLRRPRAVAAVGVTILSVALIAGAITLARTPLPVPEDRGYTELSFGRISADASTLDVRVQSMEAREREFVLRISLPGAPARDTPLVLAPGDVVTEAIPLSTSASGPLRAELLSGGAPGSEVYRHIRVDLPLSDPAPAVPAGATRDA